MGYYLTDGPPNVDWWWLRNREKSEMLRVERGIVVAPESHWSFGLTLEHVMEQATIHGYDFRKVE